MTDTAVVEKTLADVEREAIATAAANQVVGLLGFDELMDAQDIITERVNTDEWKQGSYLLFATTDAETAMAYAKELDETAGNTDATFRLMVQSLVDDAGNRRVTNKGQADMLIQVFKKRSVGVVDRCIDAVFKVNRIPIPTRKGKEILAKIEQETKNVSGEVASTTSPTN